MQTVDDKVTVCRGWFEIEDAVFGGKEFTPGRMVDRLREMMNFRAGQDD
jgi:hypothetical protein